MALTAKRYEPSEAVIAAATARNPPPPGACSSFTARPAARGATKPVNVTRRPYRTVWVWPAPARLIVPWAAFALGGDAGPVAGESPPAMSIMHAAESTSGSPRPRTVKCVFKHAFLGLLPTGLAVGLAPHGRRYGWTTSRFAPAAGWRQWVPRLRA